MKLESLNKRKDFNILFSKGKRIFKQHLTVIYYSLNDEDSNSSSLKIAYIISKKISPKAVVRNKLKRQMRAAIRQITAEVYSDNALNQTILFAILPYKKILDASFQQIYLEIEEALKKIIVK